MLYYTVWKTCHSFFLRLAWLDLPKDMTVRVKSMDVNLQI